MESALSITQCVRSFLLWAATATRPIMLLATARETSACVHWIEWRERRGLCVSLNALTICKALRFNCPCIFVQTEQVRIHADRMRWDAEGSTAMLGSGQRTECKEKPCASIRILLHPRRCERCILWSYTVCAKLTLAGPRASS